MKTPEEINEMERVKNKLHEQVKTQSETIGMYQEICQEVFGEQNPIYVKQKIANQNKDSDERKYTEAQLRDALEFAFKLDNKTPQFIKNNGFDAYIKLL
jgi:hypothetical protein